MTPVEHLSVIATRGEGLDVRRRYLVPAGHLQLPGEPTDVHLSLYTWHDRLDGWLVGQALCGRSVEGVPVFGRCATCAGCAGWLPTYEQALGQELAALRSRAEDRTARALAGDTVENGAWFTVWLESRWEWVTSRMTTEQREYAADRVAAYSAYLAELDGEPERKEPDGLRWWRGSAR
ncbi:hypothetical protein [Streptomyces roseoviridis]|uniref:Cytochrome c domain-containing protein n=1 Tax=Streptomyces roseoviridis TaxID=67361 RepID=A0ABV5QZX5_9ACTN